MSATRRLIAVVAAVVVLGLPTLAGALSVNEVAREVRCPTCNTSLDVSNAPIALSMKEFIRTSIDQGMSKQQIIDALVADFGEDVLATPPKSGFGLTAWLVPIGVALAGLVLVPVLTRSWARRRRTDTETAPPLSADQNRIVDEELGRLGPS